MGASIATHPVMTSPSRRISRRGPVGSDKVSSASVKKTQSTVSPDAQDHLAPTHVLAESTFDLLTLVSEVTANRLDNHA